MSKKEKLIARLMSEPADFTFGEETTLMRHLGYTIDNGGKTSGSLVIFRHSGGDRITLHKPHPSNVLKRYQVKDTIAVLKRRNLI